MPAPEAPAERRGRPLRVLVADDDAGNRRFLAAVLASRGHVAVLTEDGRQALAAFAREPFDVVLLDLRMPGMDGIGAAAALRAHEAATGGRVPILAMTGDASEDDRARCLAAGMDGHLAKPVPYRELIERIEGIAAPLSAEAQAADEPPPGETSRDSILPALADLADRFVADALGLGREIQAALARRDAPALKTAAHQLYGSAGLFRAERTRALAHRLEERADAADFSPASQALAVELLSELAALERELLRDRLVP